MRKTLMHSALVMALAGSGAAIGATGIWFDSDGAGGSFSSAGMSGMDWNAGNILAKDCFPLGNPLCTMYLQTKISSLDAVGGGSVAFDSAGHEFTMVIKVKAESVLLAGSIAPITGATPVGTTIQFRDLAPIALFGDATSEFKIFYDVKNADDLTGTGFEDGSLILSGLVGIEKWTVTNLSADFPTKTIDSTTSQNPTGTTQAGVTSLELTGSATFQVNVRPGTDTIDTNFFTHDFATQATTLTVDIVDDGRSSDPFTTSEPGPLVRGNVPVFGSGGDSGQNDFDCGPAALPCDLQMEADPKSVFKATFIVPEPGSLALLSLSLGLLGFGGRKLRK